MKPGWKTTEYWLTLASQITGALLASGALTGSLVLQVVGGIQMVLTALGYTAGRYLLKKNQSETYEISLVRPPSEAESIKTELK